MMLAESDFPVTREIVIIVIYFFLIANIIAKMPYYMLAKFGEKKILLLATL